jgi:hypothetical protein
MSLAILGKAPVHPTEELLEEYGFGRVREPALAALEEHLLVCSLCQTRLEELDEYAALLKAVLSRREGGNQASPAPSRPWSSRPWSSRPWLAPPRIPGAAALLLAALLVILVSTTIAWHAQPVPPAATVQLAALRGGESGGLSQAPSDRPLDLTVDSANLPPAPAYRLELVNQSGRKIWSGQAALTGTRLWAHVASGLPPGVYWIRLYSSPIYTSQNQTAQNQLLREFGMRLE